MPPTVCIIGCSGALGFGLALRLGQVGVPIVVGSRDAGRAQETVSNLSEHVPNGSFAGYTNEGVATAIGLYQDAIEKVPQKT